MGVTGMCTLYLYSIYLVEGNGCLGKSLNTMNSSLPMDSVCV